ncbi:hypothetical protein EBI01_01680 [Marinomonas rhizomae]|uniref:Uncharacterized protein n=1 Tax=Marinomonas rhizomae TaxID=491948 RepID=A0A366JHL3_9GAMM|nr:hypothetical protein [Marinomonas rhizomae]RBP85815.1 hypothetical protein DFP80_101310 [Marinomonas rhizomae]RNF75568.1 hypothetical protein EBI01_01680 [Marinomonas rhizomae]
MQIQSIVQWMSESNLNHYIITHSYVWPTLESLHFIGLCLLFGSLLFIDLRALGLARMIPFPAVEPFILVSLIGFFINLATGVAFLFGDPSRYFINPSFQLKMLCIILALLNALYFSLRMKKRRNADAIEQGGNEVVMPLDMKLAAGVSLALWIAVIVFGRLIPYVE